MVLYQYAIDLWVKPIINRNVEAGRAAGVEEGIEKGIERGIEQGIEQGMEQGRDEGREESNREWRAWLARKADAESRGLPFDEPMPDERRG